MPHAFFGTFFRIERKYYPPSGRQPHHPRRSRRVNPHLRQGVCACGRTKGLSARPLETFGHQSWREPIGLQALLPRRSRRVNPHLRQGVCACGRTKGLSARPLEIFGHRSWRETHRTANPIPRRSRRVNPHPGQGYAPAGALEASLRANHRRGPHCRALSTPLRATAPHAFFPFVNAPYTTSINPAKNIRYNG